MLEIREVDAASGNNVGQEMIEQMVEFFLRPPPPKEYKNMEEFLLYRHVDAALPYVLSCAKFSLNCPVDLTSARLERYIHLVKDHVSIANDLGSWKKEKQAFDSGKVLYMINAVDVMNKLVSRHTTQAAVAITQALQLHIETEIDAEIERLISENALTAEEWRFVDGTLRMISGNVLCSIVMSRYGGRDSE
ncbi:hypothetical protein N7499_000567 [Penicillium canescens]|uniref:Isoprenoid synthase domain-containing protein n=1 Tax=Penicillium canescens TaxID=5083 RepID=A0AAD6IH35_PENCN|nr:uncharacterized protein N7446_011231 [Penicillium canescens]KAJ6047850.1 hypothetical protein N7460_003997 [Penicillium canescens]KAJ6048548.1 hypothetical protein N7446_011231 [Penicillium canescens]KAJ6100937.1 hypothetical protein N7499_000567 [Penicillium canescens]